MPLLHQLILFIFLLAPQIHALALAPQQQNPAVDAKLKWPENAPPFPWNENECRHPRFPDFYLTFTWGRPLPRDVIYAITQEAQAFVREVISQRMGNKPVPSPDGFSLAWSREENVELTVRPHKKYMFSKNRFSVFQASDAEQLIEYCGLQSQVYREMWAFVFRGPQQIGYIWLAESEVDASEPVAGTAANGVAVS
ncbi:MAG: hypothetical protein Q9216_002290 [Gyalolechia sp. 2 TL-2023]